jgi:hypothetical protein
LSGRHRDIPLTPTLPLILMVANWFDRERSILLPVSWHSIVPACLVLLQAPVCPFPEMVLY